MSRRATSSACSTVSFNAEARKVPLDDDLTENLRGLESRTMGRAGLMFDFARSAQ